MSSPEKAVVTPEGRKVLAQDLPQYERSVYPARVRKFKKEKKEFDTAKSQYEKDLAAYEKEKAEFERKEKEAQRKYEKELAEFEKKFKSDYGISYDEYQRRTGKLEEIKKSTVSEIKKLEEQKKQAVQNVPTTETYQKRVGSGGGFPQGDDTDKWVTVTQPKNRDQLKLERSQVAKKFDKLIHQKQIGSKENIQRAEFSLLYPKVTLGGSWYRDWQKELKLKGSGVGTLVQEYEQELKRREGQAAEARSLSIKQAQGEALKLSAKYQQDVTAFANQAGAIRAPSEAYGLKPIAPIINPLRMQRPTKEFTKRASAVKPTPDVITGKPAEKSRRPLTGVKTGSFIYGDYFLEGDPRARVKGMFRTPDVSPEPPQTAYLYKGKTVKEPSAKELLKFQLQLKTRTAPSPAIYEGILEEKGLPVTPLVKEIIQEYSARRATKEGIKTARGPKPTYTDPKTGETFSAETMLGSKKIAQALGYKIPEQTKQYEFKGQIIADPSAIALLEFQSRVKTPTLLSPSIYKGILEEKGLPYTPQARQVVDTFSSDQPRIELSRAGGPKGVITDPKTGDRFDLKKMKGDRKIAKGLGIAVDERPLSSTGQRFEFYLGEIEKQQRKYAKYGDEPGQLLHYGLEFPKDLLAGGAYLENIMREGGAFITGKPSPTRPIQIPETSFGVFADELIKTKQPIAAGFAVKRYEQEFGRGSSAGAIAALAVPIPFGEKLRLVVPPLKAVGKRFDEVFKIQEKVDFIKGRHPFLDPKTGTYRGTRQELREQQKAFEAMPPVRQKAFLTKKEMAKRVPTMEELYFHRITGWPLHRRDFAGLRKIPTPKITKAPVEIGTRVTPKIQFDSDQRQKIYPDITKQKPLTRELVNKPIGKIDIPKPPTFGAAPSRPTSPKPFTQEAPKRPQQLLLLEKPKAEPFTRTKQATTKERDIMFYPRPRTKLKPPASIVEYETIRYPPISRQTPKLLQTVTPKLGIGLLTSQLLNIKQTPLSASALSERAKLRQFEVARLVQLERPKLDSVQKQRERTKQRPRLVISEREIITPKTMTGVKSIPKLKAPTLQVFSMSTERPEPLRMFIPKQPTTGKGRGRSRRKPLGFRTKEPERKKRSKEKENFLFGFLGNVPEGQVSGIFKRQEITYGTKRIQKLSLGDVRVTKGLKRATKRKTTWYEGKKSDPFGFKNEAKKIQKRAKKKGVSFW